MDFPNLLRPVQVGPFVLKNRIAVAPHGPGYARDGLLTQQYVDYEVEKAKGGAGLIIMSVGWAYPRVPATISISAWRRENIPFFKEIVARVRERDCRIFFQVAESFQRIGAGASAVPDSGHTGAPTRAMSVADIREMMAAYRACAEILMDADFDGVEMHGHGDLFSDFLSPTINRRTDEYGGSLDNRMRFILEAAESIRDVIGRGKALGVRLSIDDHLPGSIALDDGVEIARRLAERADIDYLNIDAFIEPQLLSWMIAPMYVAQGHQLYASAAVKQVVSTIPVFTVGRIVDPQVAEQAIADGAADVVTMARALIADPELPNKIAEGRADDVRPCLGDNQECIARVTQGLPMACTVNAAVGREGEWGAGQIQKAAAPRRVLVVGGGPAGLEAARVAALRGHRVTLHEQADALGGQVRMAQRLPGRAELGRIIPWLARQLDKLGVEIMLDSTMAMAEIVRRDPEVVVLATGGRWLKSGFNSLNFALIAGWEQDHVLSVEDVLNGAPVGRNVLIFDAKGFVEAPGIAELLADRGARVRIVTPFPLLGVDALRHTQQWRHIMPRLIARDIQIITDVMVEAVRGQEVMLRNVHAGSLVRETEIDSVVVISERAPNDDLWESLQGVPARMVRVGDCDRPFNIGKAIADGFRAGITA